jgi:hypothetical protein
MARPIRNTFEFTEESANKLLQEINNDLYNSKAKTVRLFTKWESKVKEDGNIAAIGEQIIKLIGAESKITDQKITLLKYIKEVAFQKIAKSDDEEKDKGVMTDNRRNELMNWVQEEREKKSKLN